VRLAKPYAQEQLAAALREAAEAARTEIGATLP
jgi:hypothetical protein